MNRRVERINHPSSEFYYWENLIRLHEVEDMIKGSMGNKNITSDSIIVYIGFLDGDKDIFKSGWSVHKDVNTMIGYLKHVFFPTAFYSWLDRESEGFFIPLSPFEVVRNEVMKLKEATQLDIEDANYIQDLISNMNGLGDLDRLRAIEALKHICTGFNERFDNLVDRKMYISIFGHSEEIVSFILGDEEEYFEEVIEEEINMTIDELKQLCGEVYEEPLINRTFIDHLNQEIPVWF